MSLLLDARKKIELALEQSGVHSAVEPQLSDAMRHDDTPPASTPHKIQEEPPQNPRATGQNLFAAKAAPARKSIGIIPVAIVGGLVLAAGGGYYVWREISPPPMAQQNIRAPQPATPIVNAAPTPQPAAAPAPQPAPAMANDQPVPAAKDNEPVLALNDKTARVPATNGHGGVAPPEHETRISHDRSPTLTSPGGRGDKVSPREPRAKSARVKKSAGKAPASPASTDAPPAAPQGAATAQPVRIEQGSDGAVDPTLLAAWQAYRNGDLGAAWQRYSDVLRNDAKNRDALLGLAAIAQQQSQDATAAHYYEQVLALDPRDPLAHAGMSALFGATNAEGTESRLKLLISQQPQSAALNFALGNRYAEQSRWAEAQQAYFKAYNIDPGNAQFAFNLAVSLDHLGQGKPAAQYYQRALQLDKSGNSGFDRGQIQQRLHELTPP